MPLLGIVFQVYEALPLLNYWDYLNACLSIIFSFVLLFPYTNISRSILLVFLLSIITQSFIESFYAIDLYSETFSFLAIIQILSEFFVKLVVCIGLYYFLFNPVLNYNQPLIKPKI